MTTTPTRAPTTTHRDTPAIRVPSVRRTSAHSSGTRASTRPIVARRGSVPTSNSGAIGPKFRAKVQVKVRVKVRAKVQAELRPNATVHQVQKSAYGAQECKRAWAGRPRRVVNCGRLYGAVARMAVVELRLAQLRFSTALGSTVAAPMGACAPSRPRSVILR